MGYLAELRDAGATVIVVHHISLKKKVSADTWNPMELVLNSTIIVSSSDTAFTVIQVPINKPTMFIIKPQARRVSLKYSELFAVKLLEDDSKSFARLLTIDEIPSVPVRLLQHCLNFSQTMLQN